MEKPETEKVPTSFACTLCSATFGRLEHLQRHTTSAHSAERPFPCTFCSQTFARRDVLGRHLKSCKANTGSETTSNIVPPRRRGRKRRSCEMCARLKRACSGAQPCLSCVHRKQVCSFPAAPSKPDGESSKVDCADEVDGSISGEDWDRNNLLSPLSNMTSLEGHTVYQDQGAGLAPFATRQEQPMQPDPSSHGGEDLMQGFSSVFDVPSQAASSLQFLANFTNTKGMANSFDCGTIEQRSDVMRILQQSSSSQFVAENGRLTAITHMIVSGLKEAVDSQRRRSNAGLSWSYTLELACSSFFALPNLRRLLTSYWAFWHPNCPIVHKPTYHIETSAPTLVAVMALIGACLSPVEADREAALMWLDVAEEWVFTSATFSDDPLPSQDMGSPGLQDRLHALQAAYCSILLQTWEGTEDAKRRARRSRYTDIIGAFRSVCAKSIIHGNLLLYVDQPNSNIAWKQYAMKEELIRTLTYIILLDSAYVIFNNTPPRMALQEARISLASPEACFQAEDSQTWQGAMRLWAGSEIGLQQPTISQVICLIWNQQLLERDWSMLQQMSSLNLFSIVHPLHVQLFHLRCHPLPGNQTQLLRQALDNWKLIHAQRTGITGLLEMIPLNANEWWKRTGFPQYALEYWSLADLILTSCETMPMMDFDQSGNVNETIVSQLLSRYDESDMSQVHDLVTLFNSMTLAI